MIGTKFYKDNYDLNAYSQAAEWCNETQQGTIEDKGEYYEVVEIVVTLEEAKQNKISELKTIRDAKEVETLQTSKGLFDYDDKSRDRLAIARQALADNRGWKASCGLRLTTSAFR